MSKLLSIKGDIIVVICFLLLAVITAIPLIITSRRSDEESSVYAQVNINGEQVLTMDMRKDDEVTLSTESGEIHIVVKDSKICIERSDCRDKICVKTGWLSSNGEVAVCLPLKCVVVVSSVVSSKEGGSQGVDAITG